MRHLKIMETAMTGNRPGNAFERQCPTSPDRHARPACAGLALAFSLMPGSAQALGKVRLYRFETTAIRPTARSLQQGERRHV